MTKHKNPHAVKKNRDPDKARQITEAAKLLGGMGGRPIKGKEPLDASLALRITSSLAVRINKACGDQDASEYVRSVLEKHVP